MKNRTGFEWFEFVLGVIMIYLGIRSFLRPNSTLTCMVILYAIAAIITGICDIVFYVKAAQYTGFGPIVSLVSGVVSMMTGMLLIAHPMLGERIIYLLFPIWFIAHNIFNLASLDRLRMLTNDRIYYLSLFISIAGLFLGFLLIINPFITLVAVGWLIGLYLILTGINYIVIALSGADSRR